MFRNGPFSDLRIIEFTHTVMGPAGGLFLSELGAEIIRVESPPEGDRTRYLGGSGAGYFAFYNRHKKSVILDLKRPEGREAALRLVEDADALIENFAPGTMERLGLDYETVRARNPRLIYCSMKGFLQGPYETRTALDEVAQVMSGLAYMTGPPGKPLRAGASIIDVLGGMSGALAILAAVHERQRTGRGQAVRASLYESAVFLMGQHMIQSARQGSPVQPMSVRDSAWAIYRIYDTLDGAQVFVGVTTDETWHRFCDVFERDDLAQAEEFSTNALRRANREKLDAIFADMIAAMTAEELVAKCLKARMPFGPLGRPEDLFDDPHLQASGQLVRIRFPDDEEISAPSLPIRLETWEPEQEARLPEPGADTRDVLTALGMSEAEIAAASTFDDH